MYTCHAAEPGGCLALGAPGTLIFAVTSLSREDRWRAARLQREAAATCHPFTPHTTMRPDELVLSNGAIDAEVVLIAFTGARDKLGIPAVEFFDAVTEPSHQVLVRSLVLPLLAHDLGTDVPSAVGALDEVIRGRPALMVGHSLGAFSALLFGTLCRVSRVLAVNPTTSLRPHRLKDCEDDRYGFLDTLGEVPHEFSDIPSLWEGHVPPPVDLHFGYRSPPHRGHAEHIAEFENVTVRPYYQFHPMYELSRTGRLGPLIDRLLREARADADGAPLSTAEG